MACMVRWGMSISIHTRIVGSFVCFLVIMVAIPVGDAAFGEQRGLFVSVKDERRSYHNVISF